MLIHAVMLESMIDHLGSARVSCGSVTQASFYWPELHVV